MVNCNPETVSTDYDTSDRLYFEPLTLEDVLRDRRRREAPEGVIVQFGGQTPLRLAAAARRRRGVTILGTSPDSIDLAEDREAVRRAARGARIPRARSGAPRASLDEARDGRRARSGIPVLVRPSYVLGGRAM